MYKAIVERTEATDQQLVELARSGDQQAFGQLIQRCWRKCVNIGCFFLRNRCDAEDQAQNAVLKAYERLDQYHGEAEFATWLGRIVANECLMLMRARRRSRFVYLDETPDPGILPFQLASSDPDPEGDLAFLQLTEVMKLEMARLPRLMRNVMSLRDIQDLPMKDVADRLGVSVSAAKSRLVRARIELRLRMARHYTPLRASSSLSRTAASMDRLARHCTAQVAH